MSGQEMKATQKAEGVDVILKPPPSKVGVAKARTRGHSAADEVFSVPELVTEVCKFLLRDRIDLIALGSVNKSCRRHALALWAQVLDIQLERVTNLFHFFVANPTLLGHTKHVRFVGMGPDGEDSEKRRASLWQDFGRLMTVLAVQPATLQRPPTLHLCVLLRDTPSLVNALSPFRNFLGSIVALHVLSGRRANLRQSEKDCQQMVLDLASWIQQCQREAFAQRKTGLLAFSWGDMSSFFGSVDEGGYLLSLGAWTIMALSLRWSLRELTLTLTAADASAKILAAIDFPNLVHCAVRHNLVNGAALDECLQKHQKLESVLIKACSQEDKHTYQARLPLLRHLQANLNLSTEQGHFRSSRRELLTADRTLFYPKQNHADRSTLPSLRQALSVEIDMILQQVRVGGPLARIRICSKDTADISQLAAFFAQLHKLPNSPATALTCLEMDMSQHSFGTTLSAIQDLAQSGHLPNLAELQIPYTSAVETEDKAVRVMIAELEVQSLLTALLPMRALRVLRLRTMKPLKMVRTLRAPLFPARLEYLLWQEHTAFVIQSYRFISESMTTGSSTTRSVSSSELGEGKGGSLVEVPSLFRQRISADGVWGPNVIKEWTNPVLDHLQSPPVFDLR